MMNLRLSMWTVAIVAMFALVGCDKSELKEAQGKADEAAAQASKSEEEAKAAKAEADEAKAAAEAAKGEAETAKAEAEGAKAVAEGAKAAEAAAKEVAEGAKAAVEGAQAEVEAAQAAAEEAKGAAEAAQAELEGMMMAQAERDEAAVLGIMIQNYCLRQSKVAPEKMGAMQKDILKSFGMTPERFRELRANLKASPGFKEAYVAGKENCPEMAPEEVVAEEEPAVEEPEEAAKPAGGKAKPAKKNVRHLYKGTFFGSRNGKIKIDVNGNKVRATMIVMGESTPVVMTGKKSGNNVVFTGLGNKGKDAFKAQGKISKNNKSLTGVWRATRKGEKGSYKGAFKTNR